MITESLAISYNTYEKVTLRYSDFAIQTTGACFILLPSSGPTGSISVDERSVTDRDPVGSDDVFLQFHY